MLGRVVAWIQSEVVVLSALASAVLDLVILLGIRISPEEKAAILVVVNLVLALVARSQVSPLSQAAPPGAIPHG